jgi:5-methyltetrahydrofolate--homocysteine methyltransferase
MKAFPRIMSTFLDLLKQRVVVYDGAMGTSIQGFDLTLEDYWQKENCSEVLTLSRPEIIADIHRSYFAAGADIVETNTFGGSSLVLGEFDIAERTREINLAAARLARSVADEFATPERPRFIAGSVGPTTKLPSLGHIGYDAMLATYVEQMEALIEGGVDVILIETCQDLLQAKIALAAAHDAMHKVGKQVPVQMQVTLEATGTMLLGSEIGAALAVLECFRPDILGLNCATGPKEMNDAVRFLSQNATMPISILPNAGLPQNVGGRAHYGLTPKDLADYQRRFVSEYGVQVVGGCCGTTPAHIKALAEAVQGITPATRNPKVQSVAASAFTVVPLEVDGQPAIIAEEMNTTTRVSHFKDMVLKGDYDGIFTLAKRLVNEGSQLLDICCAVVG